MFRPEEITSHGFRYVSIGRPPGALIQQLASREKEYDVTVAGARSSQDIRA
jgi:hypothetical protein